MNKPDLQVNEENLCVISDLHLGNPAFLKADYLKTFIRHLSKNGASLCINGDFIDLLQFSPQKLVKELQSALKSLKEFFSKRGKKIYYVLGNHDIHLQDTLEKLDIFSIIPFMQVISGERRIYIEHGHNYDLRYRNFPRVYQQMAKLLGKLLKVSPKFFHLYFKIEWFLHGLKNRKVNGRNSPLLDAPSNLAAALKLFTRGFDIVILAHTHRHGLHILQDGKILANAGAWTSDKTHYLEIQSGSISLKEWH
jgi:UDP-2,3-diacylglucosamine pyrophosphatase LpxH